MSLRFLYRDIISFLCAYLRRLDVLMEVICVLFVSAFTYLLLCDFLVTHFKMLSVECYVILKLLTPRK